MISNSKRNLKNFIPYYYAINIIAKIKIWKVTHIAYRLNNKYN